MSYDPAKRDSTWHMVQPGCWIDPAGVSHIFPDEVLAFMKISHPEIDFDPKSKADYDLVVDAFLGLLRVQGFDVERVKFIRHDRGGA